MGSVHSKMQYMVFGSDILFDGRRLRMLAISALRGTSVDLCEPITVLNECHTDVEDHCAQAITPITDN